MLQCLIVTRDATLLNAMSNAFAPAHVDMRLREDAASALEIATKQHFDGFVVDCDDLGGGTGVLARIRNIPGNQQSVIFAVVNGATKVAKAIDLGANFVLGKPIDPSRLKFYVDLGLPKMEREHRRYWRYPADVVAQVVLRNGELVTARVVNVSESGLGMKLAGAAEMEGMLTVRYALPTALASPLEAKATVSWCRHPLCGLRILHMDPDSRVLHEGWLNTMAGTKE